MSQVLSKGSVIHSLRRFPSTDPTFSVWILCPSPSRALDSSVSVIGSVAISCYRGFLLSTLAVFFWLQGDTALVCFITPWGSSITITRQNRRNLLFLQWGVAFRVAEVCFSETVQSETSPCEDILSKTQTQPREFWHHALLHCLGNSACCHVYPNTKEIQGSVFSAKLCLMLPLNAFRACKLFPSGFAHPPLPHQWPVSAVMHLMAPSLSGLREDSRQAEIEIAFLFAFLLFCSLLSHSHLIHQATVDWIEFLNDSIIFFRDVQRSWKACSKESPGSMLFV